jgi:hypothetical protein
MRAGTYEAPAVIGQPDDGIVIPSSLCGQEQVR